MTQPGRLRFAAALLCTALVAALTLLPEAEPLHGKTRGIRVQTREGKPIDLYSGSYALVVGNGAYTHWDPLPGAVRDVKDVARVLEKNGFQVTLKENVTRAGFEAAMADFAYRYGRNEANRLLFYYAGHGYTREMYTGEEMGYLVMVNSPLPEKDPAGFYGYNVDMQYIANRSEGASCPARAVSFRQLFFRDHTEPAGPRNPCSTFPTTSRSLYASSSRRAERTNRCRTTAISSRPSWTCWKAETVSPCRTGTSRAKSWPCT